MMKTLRAKILFFTILLLILPSLPLSYFVKQLLDKSYSIGVNERVENALDNALEISSDFYQMHKRRIASALENSLSASNLSNERIMGRLKKDLPLAKVKIILPGREWQQDSLINKTARKRFLQGKEKISIWPAPDHSNLYALSRLTNKRLLEVVYPLPKSFRKGARQIQEVSQIFKTLGFVQTDIQRSFLYVFLIIYFSGILIAFVVSYFISKRITRPIELLTAATAEIGKGNLKYRIPLKSKDEFAVLASSFNTMIEELEENQRQIINLEKMATWQQLARRLAHEIKNPLTPIQLMAQQMRDQYTGENSAYQKVLDEGHDIIVQEVDSLKKLVREFSDFARMPEFQPLEQDLRPLIKSVQKLYGPEKVRLDLPTEAVVFSYDNEYMKRALINLVDNGLSASEAGKAVLISLSKKESGTVLISIADRGEGIPAKNLQNIFEPYFSTKRSGVGLGLAIVKKIVEEHGGAIRVQSVLQEGTQFDIALPVKS